MREGKATWEKNRHKKREAISVQQQERRHKRRMYKRNEDGR